MRFRELEELLPELERRGIHVQLVTSAFRQIPARWNALSRLNVVVSVDGLQPEHDVRRKPATYERILKSIAGDQGHDPLHRHRADDGAAGLPRRLRSILERARRDEKNLDQPVHAAARGQWVRKSLRLTSGDELTEDLLRLRIAYPLIDMPAGLDRRAPASAGFAQGLHLRPHHAHCFGGPEDADYAVPVWWHPRLFTVRLYRKHGSRGSGTSSGGARRHRGTTLLTFGADRKGRKQLALFRRAGRTPGAAGSCARWEAGVTRERSLLRSRATSAAGYRSTPTRCGPPLRESRGSPADARVRHGHDGFDGVTNLVVPVPDQVDLLRGSAFGAGRFL